MQRLTRKERQQLRLIGNVVYYHNFSGIVLDVDYYPSDKYILNARVKLTLWNGREEIKTLPLSELRLAA